MNLKGSKWTMNRRPPRRSRPWRVLVLVAAIFGVLYANRYVLPNTPGLAIPTATPTRSPEAYINEAQTFFSQGKLVKAIDSYEQAVRSDPNNRSIYVELARLQIYAGQYDQALQNAQNALIGNEDYSMGQTMLAWAYANLQKFPEAESAISKAIEIDGNNATAHAVYSEILIDDPDVIGGVDKAIEESRLAVSLAPNSFEALRARGYVLNVTSNYDESIQAYQQALQIYKYMSDVYINLGLDYEGLAQPDYQQAQKMYLQAKQYNPTDPMPDVYLSRNLARLGDYAKAAQYAENAVKLDPTNPNRYGNLGIMYYNNDQFNKAIDSFSLAIHGGTTGDGQVVQGLPLSDNFFVIQYYTLFGFALAKASPNRCDQAVPIARALISTLPDDQITTDNANTILDLCKEAAGTPSAPEATATPKSKK